jgi:hypothetical protein
VKAVARVRVRVREHGHGHSASQLWLRANVRVEFMLGVLVRDNL